MHKRKNTYSDLNGSLAKKLTFAKPPIVYNSNNGAFNLLPKDIPDNHIYPFLLPADRLKMSGLTKSFGAYLESHFKLEIRREISTNPKYFLNSNKSSKLFYKESHLDLQDIKKGKISSLESLARKNCDISVKNLFDDSFAFIVDWTSSNSYFYNTFGAAIAAAVKYKNLEVLKELLKGIKFISAYLKGTCDVVFQHSISFALSSLLEAQNFNSLSLSVTEKVDLEFLLNCFEKDEQISLTTSTLNKSRLFTPILAKHFFAFEGLERFGLHRISIKELSTILKTNSTHIKEDSKEEKIKKTPK